MTDSELKPSLDLLREEYVLIQAWKKTSAYIRYHNWYADTLSLDWNTVNLRAFIAETADRLANPEQWKNRPLRIIPAPKSQRWTISKSGWGPPKSITAARLRPLAHVSLQDQVVATALMLCLANRIETRQGDPRVSFQGVELRRSISSYGNRLFCDVFRGKLRHRWGSGKLYRSYFQDYRSFVSRPVAVSQSVRRHDRQRVFIIESDLQQFYDRVRPNHLATALHTVRNDGDESGFFELARRVFDWGWDSGDVKYITPYEKYTDVSDFGQVALPQGLVASGFFANVVLLRFDESLRSRFSTEIMPGIRLEDACRYVDDLRIVVTTDLGPKRCQSMITHWLQRMLNDTAPGLLLSRDKTKVAEFGGSDRPVVLQSDRMERIQSAVSGGFDVAGGEQILDAIQGLVRSQQALRREPTESIRSLYPLPDVRDESVARFAAARFRTTYRSIRPLLDEVSHSDPVEKMGNDIETFGTLDTARSQRELDEDARAFSLGLIERWIVDPSNVRLLRIGLDIWPDPEVLRRVLELLAPSKNKKLKGPVARLTALYCLAEILRAGATETGHVENHESLPATIDLQQYRRILRDEAIRLIRPSRLSVPWYLQQQALLFLSVYEPAAVRISRARPTAETRHYRQAIRFLQGDRLRLTDSEFATLAILSRRTFANPPQSAQLTLRGLTATRKNEIAVRDPSYFYELGEPNKTYLDEIRRYISDDRNSKRDSRLDKNLAELVSVRGAMNPLRNELTLLQFSIALLHKLQESFHFEAIVPEQVWLKLSLDSDAVEIVDVVESFGYTSQTSFLYDLPDWCGKSDRWRFQLGFLLRFILAARPDFTTVIRPEYWRERSGAYLPSKTHWYQRLYGFFTGQPAFGDDWVPISDWMERFLLALLRWPGVQTPRNFEWVERGMKAARDHIADRIEVLETKRGRSTGTLLVPMTVRPPTEKTFDRNLRACIVQTIVPSRKDLNIDLRVSRRDLRKRHSKHLSAVLAAVRQMLRLRRTHMKGGTNLDWLILPELAVHPDQIKTHLIPFARAYRTLILAGLTYDELFPDQPLVNSALWIIPEWTENYGLQIHTRRQGKLHLSPEEENFNRGSIRIQGFRPCQWLVGYPWSHRREPVWLTASVCYDATDLRLVADLRDESDVFAIPAFNKDVKTFDQMALALHYHMFQIVVVANNGRYGGSNAYWPRHGEVQRQIFHLHGQPQASMAFLEINDISELLDRGRVTAMKVRKRDPDGWKYPPASWHEQ